MTKDKALKILDTELRDLDVKKGSLAWEYVHEKVLEAHDIMTVKQFKKLIEDYVNEMPFNVF